MGVYHSLRGPGPARVHVPQARLNAWFSDLLDLVGREDLVRDEVIPEAAVMDIGSLLRAMCWEPRFDEAGDLVGFEFDGCKSIWWKDAFEAMAPYVEGRWTIEMLYDFGPYDVIFERGTIAYRYLYVEEDRARVTRGELPLCDLCREGMAHTSGPDPRWGPKPTPAFHCKRCDWWFDPAR